MIGLLLALHPRAWRTRYGDEFRALLEAEPVTFAVVCDVLRNAVRQHAHTHAAVLHVAAALPVSVLVEVVAIKQNLTDNILWPPSTLLRSLAFSALVLPWLPVASDVLHVVRRRRHEVIAGG